MAKAPAPVQATSHRVPSHATSALVPPDLFSLIGAPAGVAATPATLTRLPLICSTQWLSSVSVQVT
ncbi:MAG: hypothetical protein MUC67_08750 [Acidobacteria bacterium]|nr:hypothetical protein [Acidobacteriota bacterium]